ncbi:hypothetical protein IBA8401_07340 [Pseudomonas syringae]
MPHAVVRRVTIHIDRSVVFKRFKGYVILIAQPSRLPANNLIDRVHTTTAVCVMRRNEQIFVLPGIRKNGQGILFEQVHDRRAVKLDVFEGRAKGLHVFPLHIKNKL